MKTSVLVFNNLVFISKLICSNAYEQCSISDIYKQIML
jgi:hypothetical protein